MRNFFFQFRQPLVQHGVLTVRIFIWIKPDNYVFFIFCRQSILGINNLQQDAVNMDFAQTIFVNKSVKFGIDEFLDNIIFRFIERLQRQWVRWIGFHITPLAQSLKSWQNIVGLTGAAFDRLFLLLLHNVGRCQHPCIFRSVFAVRRTKQGFPEAISVNCLAPAGVLFTNCRHRLQSKYTIFLPLKYVSGGKPGAYDPYKGCNSAGHPTPTSLENNIRTRCFKVCWNVEQSTFLCADSLRFRRNYVLGLYKKKWEEL